MGLLIDDILGKIFGFTDNINPFFIRTFTKLILFFIFLSLIFSIIKSYIDKKFFWLTIILFIYILAELAHFIRKTREKQLSKK